MPAIKMAGGENSVGPVSALNSAKELVDKGTFLQPNQHLKVLLEFLQPVQTILERMNKIYRTMEVLKHTSTCVNPLCTFDSCSKVKELFQHAVGCAARAEGGCNPCR